MTSAIIMLKKHFAVWLQLAILILQYNSIAFGISATISPNSMTAFVNESVEFHCQIGDSSGEELVWIFDYDLDDDVWTVVSADKTTEVEHHLDGHGKYSVEYSEEFDGGWRGAGWLYNLVLKIEDLQLADEGIFACGYRDNPSSVPLSSWANLTLLVPPDETNPTCTFDSPIPVSSAAVLNQLTITLNCELRGGKPLPGLTWWRDGTPISETRNTDNALQYTLAADDNGVPLTCIASGQALSEDGSCSITPVQIIPSVIISNLPILIAENADVILKCTSFGLPYISELNWIYGGHVLADAIVPFTFQVVDLSDSSSELHLFDVQLDNNEANITCRAETPSGLSNEQAVSISVLSAVATAGVPDDATAKASLSTDEMSTENVKNPKAASQQTTSVTVPIATTVGVFILILVIAIIATILYRRYKSTKKGNSDHSQVPIATNAQENTYEMEAGDMQLTSPSSNYHEIDPLSGNVSADGPRSITMVSDHTYDSVNFGGQSETRTPENVAPSAGQPQQISPYASNAIVRNVEGISYADLDLSNVPQSDTIHPNSSPVVYSAIEGEL